MDEGKAEQASSSFQPQRLEPGHRVSQEEKSPPPVRQEPARWVPPAQERAYGAMPGAVRERVGEKVFGTPGPQVPVSQEPPRAAQEPEWIRRRVEAGTMTPAPSKPEQPQPQVVPEKPKGFLGRILDRFRGKAS